MKKILSCLPVLLFFLVSNVVVAQEKNPVKHAPSALSSPALYLLIGIIILLLVAILSLGESVKAAAQFRSEKDKNNNITKVLLVVLSLGLTTGTVSAQETTAPVSQVTEVVQTGNDYWGLDASVFYAFCAIIAFELLVIFILRNITLQLLDPLRDEIVKATVPKPSLMERLNASVTIEQEADIMLDHEYDGIRELDNDLPPWWKYGFYVSIVFSCIYLTHYHITKTGKLQIAEYDAEVKKANEEIAEYRKKAADMVDENTVTLLTDESSINEGKNIFTNNCVACHGKLGEGGVGPNLTDDYWLHKGGIQDVFKSIKYGWPEKGMKSWQQDLSPKQIHQVASYIKSLRGTHPANPKEKQGELYAEEKTPVSPKQQDSTAVVKTK